MKKSAILALAFFVGMAFFTACQTTDVVESGTYQGTISEVEPEKDEIYVKTDDDKTLELYFTPETRITSSQGDPVDFSVLEEDMRVEVEVEKVGQRLDPIAVRILE